MKTFILSLLAVVSTVVASEKLLGSSEGVEIITKELFRNNGKYYGNRFYARNKQKGDATVILKVTSGKNLKNELSTIPLTVPGMGETLLGDLLQDDQHQEWEWYVDWVITR